MFICFYWKSFCTRKQNSTAFTIFSKKWSTSWSNSSTNFFNKQTHLPFFWKHRVWEIQLFRTAVINNFQHANSSTFTEQVDCKRWNLSWPNFTNYCFNNQIHLLFLTRTDCKRQRHPSPHSLTSIFKKQIHIRLLKNRVYEIKQFFTEVIKWFFQ